MFMAGSHDVGKQYLVDVASSYLEHQGFQDTA
jgi:hypothetical protein